MSTAIERLKALAAAKRAAEAKEKAEEPNNEKVQPVGHTGSGQPNPISASSAVSGAAGTGSYLPSTDRVPDSGNPAGDNSVDSPDLPSGVAGEGQVTKPASDHPLVMELAELEQALLQQLPEFKTILKDIHGKLRQDPELVAIMTEEEIELVVRGLTKHATVEIIAPKAAKAARKSAKTPISAADL